jgi:hypothetical protein
MNTPVTAESFVCASERSPADPHRMRLFDQPVRERLPVMLEILMGEERQSKPLQDSLRAFSRR